MTEKFDSRIACRALRKIYSYKTGEARTKVESIFSKLVGRIRRKMKVLYAFIG